MVKQLFNTKENWSQLIIRVMLGAVIFPHGAQKLLGWFGGYGFSGTMGFFTESLGLPWVIGFLVILIEFFGPLLLIAGLFTRFMAFSIFCQFIGIIFTSHIQYGFFMNWFGNQQGEGYEYHLLILGMAAALTISGAGKLALDKYLLQKLE